MQLEGKYRTLFDEKVHELTAIEVYDWGHEYNEALDEMLGEGLIKVSDDMYLEFDYDNPTSVDYYLKIPDIGKWYSFTCRCSAFRLHSVITHPKHYMPSFRVAKMISSLNL